MALTFSVPDTELTATLANRRPGVVDQIFKRSALLNIMRAKGGVEMLDGGESIVRNVRFAKNTAAGSFSGYDLLDTTPQDAETAAKYPWRSLFATISIAWDEEQRNMGRSQVFNLLNQKTDDATDTLKDLFNTQLSAAAPAAGSKDLCSLQEIVQTTPSSAPARTDSTGSIAAAQTWWRNKATSMGAFSIAKMNTMYNDVSDGAEFPSCLFSGQTVYEYYENTQVGQIRYGDTATADAGFQNQMYKQTPWIWDPNIGITDSLFFLNLNYLKLNIKTGADFITTDFVKPDNQAARVAQILVMANMTCSARRRQGTLYSITAPA